MAFFSEGKPGVGLYTSARLRRLEMLPAHPAAARPGVPFAALDGALRPLDGALPLRRRLLPGLLPRRLRHRLARTAGLAARYCCALWRATSFGGLRSRRSPAQGEQLLKRGILHGVDDRSREGAGGLLDGGMEIRHVLGLVGLGL